MGESESIFEAALTRFTGSLASAFKPLLDPVSIRHELDRQLCEFLGTGSLFAREHVFEQLDVPNALWAIHCWTTLADGSDPPKATVLPLSDVKFVKLPSYTDVEIAPGKSVPCLSAGRILLERGPRRCVIEVRERTRTLYEELVVELIVADGSPDGDTIAADFEAALRRYDPNRGQHLTVDKAGLRFLDPPDVTWDDVVLPETAKEEIRRNVTSFLRAHRDGSSPILPPSRSLLLSGPPGTGKTLVGKALTSELEGITFLWVTPGGFDHFGDSGYFFRWARERTPAVVFLEDLDLVAEIRGTTSTLGLGEMLAQMDGFKSNEGLVIIATTNEPEAIDEALRRPGRFDRHIEFELPDEDGRRRILERFLKPLPFRDRHAALETLVASTRAYSGAHLRELADTLALLQLEASGGAGALSAEHVEQALSSLRRSRGDLGFQP